MSLLILVPWSKHERCVCRHRPRRQLICAKASSTVWMTVNRKLSRSAKKQNAILRTFRSARRISRLPIDHSLRKASN